MNFDGQKICGVPDHLGGGDCAWPFPKVSIYATGLLGQVNLGDAAEQAIAGWNAVCGVELFLAANPKSAHIAITSGHIDGPSGTLGWSELPCGFTAARWRQLQQKYDAGEVWVVSDNPPANKIDAVRVICHEVGHAIGISHINDSNLMAPVYSARIRWPQRGDIAEAVMRYGKKIVPSPTTPTPAPANPSDPGEATWGRVFPCLLTYGVDVFAKLSPEERSGLLDFGLSIWRNLRPTEKQILRQLADNAKNPTVQ
jgi:hypothetical protein